MTTTTKAVTSAPDTTTTTTTTTVTTTAPITYTTPQSSTDNINTEGYANEQTGIPQISTSYPQTTYSGYSEAPFDESEPTAEEDIPTSVSSEGEVSEHAESIADTESVAYTESVMETSSHTEKPVITLNAKQAQAFTLIAAAFGVVIAATVIAIKVRGKKKKEESDLSALTAKERDEIRLREEDKKKPKEKKIKKKKSVPKTVQKTLPYQRVCDDYIFKVDDNRYSKTYQFEDVNYQIAKQDEQESIFLGYCSVLNSFDTNADIQLTVHNNRVNKADFERMVLIRHRDDGYDNYRDEYNNMLIEKMEQGQNGIIRNKYITVTLQAADLENARSKFNTIDLDLLNAFKKVGSNIKALTSNERICLLKDIFRNVDEEIPELTAKHFKRQAERAYCCPDYMEFKKDYFMWGDKYARTMFIKDMPASLKDCMLTDIANTNLDVILNP